MQPANVSNDFRSIAYFRTLPRMQGGELRPHELVRDVSTIQSEHPLQIAFHIKKVPYSLPAIPVKFSGGPTNDRTQPLGFDRSISLSRKHVTDFEQTDSANLSAMIGIDRIQEPGP